MQRENTLTREIHSLLQGSDDWHAFRFNHHGASEAAAMLGLSKKATRSELVRMKATGLAKEFSDWVQENILDYGHEVEALARPHAEKIIGDELYPATLSLGKESASCDGLNMAETIGFEHKQWNAALAASVSTGVLPEEHQPQVQQQLMVTGADKWLFMTSDGTEESMVWMWIYPDTAWFERIVAGWEQFDIDVVNYRQVDIIEKPAAEPICALPALVVQTEGKVVSSNLAAYKGAAERFLAGIKTELVDDQDFADAENNVKFCGEAEGKLELAKAAALAQTATIDEVMRTVDHIKAQFRTKRLELEKLVKTRKEQIKETILNEGRHEFTSHVAALEAEITPLRLQQQQPDFAGAMKNKRTLASLRDAVSTTLANAKIAANTQAADYRAKQAWCKEHAAGYGFLFMDMPAIIGKPMEDFQLVINTRIADHKRAEEVKQEALRAQIAAQEQAKAEAAAAAKLAAERKADADRLAAEQARVAEEAKVATERQAAAEQAERDRAAALAEQGRLSDLANQQAAQAQVHEAAPAKPSATSAVSPTATDLFAEAGTAKSSHPSTPPTLRLGQINERIAPLAINADGLRALGFEPSARDRAAMFYHEHEFASICAALIRHLGSIQAKQAA